MFDAREEIGPKEQPKPEFYLEPTSGTAGNGLPIYSWEQAATQLTREGFAWSTSLGSAAVVTYSFRSTAPQNMPEDTTGFSRFSEAQIAAAEAALAAWAAVANITFQRIGTGTGDAAYSNAGTIRFSNYSSGVDGAAAFAFLPGGYPDAGDVWVNISLSSNQDLTLGEYGVHTLAHEIGHAIGLSHPGNYDGGSPTYPGSATYWQDSRAFTIMSYFGSSGVGHSLNAFAASPQLHDIAAAQRLYGANMSTRTGDTIYGFNSNTGLAIFTMTSNSSSPVFAVWDAGGNDTFDFSGYSTASEIDLRAESFSSAGPGNSGVGIAVGNISIAKGVVIENAIGGSGNDTIIGNSANNILDGRAGADSMTGGAGNDQYYVDNAGDTVTELASEGTDTVYTSITYTLTANVEELSATGVAAINLYGNALNNLIVGNSAVNTLDGGAGADTMIGGLGDDLYVIDNISDTVIENVGEGTDTIYTGLAFYTMGANVENLQITGTAGSYVVGNALANLMAGGSGADALDGGIGADFMAGGAGDDSYFVDNISDVVVELANAGTDVIYTSLAFYTMGDNVEQVSITAATGSYIVGNALDNLMVGNAGADALDGGLGVDTLVGGAGDDSYFVDNIADLIIELSGEGTDVVYTNLAFYQIADNVEQVSVNGTAGSYIVGNALDNLLVGNAGSDALDGGLGADFMVGGAGDDFYFVDNVSDVVVELANEGTDVIYTGLGFYTMGDNVEQISVNGGSGSTLIGNALDNLMVGGASVDSLNGGAGADTLTGNGGNDVFVFAAGQANGDTITDFTGNGAAAGDVMHFTGYGTAAAGATFVQIDATHWQINSADGLIHDIITLANGASVDASDYVFG